jgi:hypothetical protein
MHNKSKEFKKIKAVLKQRRESAMKDVKENQLTINAFKKPAESAIKRKREHSEDAENIKPKNPKKDAPTNEDILKKKEKQEEKRKKMEELTSLVINEVQEGERRSLASEPLQEMEGDIFFQWSSLGKANYILPRWGFLCHSSPFSVTNLLI